MKKVLAVLVLFASAPAFAQSTQADAGSSPDAGSDVPAAAPDAGAASGSSMLDEIDAAAGAPVKVSPTQQAAPVAAPTPTARGFQSMNPDISVIIDTAAGFAQHAPYSLAGDDPDLKGGSKEHPAGITVQEAEVGFQSIVDPYFRADMFLTIPNLQGLEVEEAFVTTLALPADLQVKAGIFRSAFGRQNGQHLHLQDFTRRPLVNAAYLGTDGLRQPGVQLSWLAPTPFFLQLVAEAFSAAPPDDRSQFTTFGGGQRTDVTTTFEAKVFVPAGESLSLYGGLNAAFGRGNVPFTPSGDNTIPANLDAASQLYAADLYVKYKPPNEVGGYFNVAWQTEYFYRKLSTSSICTRDADNQCVNFTVPIGAGSLATRNDETDGGFYTQLVMQLARSWKLGIREDLLGVPTSDIQPRVNRVSASLTYITSEFARLRVYGEREDVTHGNTCNGVCTGLPSAQPNATNYMGLLQLEIAMGAHGAHPF